PIGRVAPLSERGAGCPLARLRADRRQDPRDRLYDQMGPLSQLARHKTAVLLSLLLVAASAAAQTDGGHSPASCQGIATVAGTALATELVADGFKMPVHLAAPPHDVSRLFVVEQDGAIKLIKSGKTLARPFLDIRERVRSGGERGLLSIAFHPDYASNRRFFVYFTEATGDLVIAEFASSATDPAEIGRAHA